MTNQLPGDTTLPSNKQELLELAQNCNLSGKYQVKDFFTKPSLSAYQISPKGDFLSFRKRNDEGKSDIYLLNRKTGEERLFIKEGDDVIRGYGWVNDDTLVFMQDNGGDENYHIFVQNIKEENYRDLTPFEKVRATISESLKDDSDHIIIEMNKDNPELFEPYKLNVHTGNLEKLYENIAGENPIAGFGFDKDGDLRCLVRIENGQDQAFYYNIDGEMVKIKHTEFGESFDLLEFDYQNDNKNIAFVRTTENRDKAIICRYDLRNNCELEEVFSHDIYDANDILLSRKRGYELDAITYNGAKPETIVISETFAKIKEELTALLGEENRLQIVDKDDDERYFIILSSSDRDIGTYYLFDRSEQKIQMLAELLPNLDRKDMSEMMPIEFTSRDGLTIHGYFSRPNNSKAKKLPMVVMVHGGPQGIRDSWCFNPDVQLLTSAGFAVLQVNFRISGGYGKSFLQAGFGQVGRKTMDDVEDGVQYVIDNGWVEPSKIAIYGASHGGFAVLRGLVKTPDLYACGIDYVGVSNLYTFMESIPPYWEIYRKMMYTIWYDPTDESQQEIMNEVSPLQNSEKITKPLFVVQGANDPRVNINEADQIVKNLRDRGVDVPYMVKYDEGHGFAKESNRLELYQCLVGFLQQHLG